MSYFIPESVRDWRIFFWGTFTAQFTRGLFAFDVTIMVVAVIVFVTTLAGIHALVRVRRYRLRIEKRVDA